jgi:thymidylate synthase
MLTLKTQFDAVLADIRYKFARAPAIESGSWQSTKAPDRMVEILNYSFCLDLPTTDLDLYRKVFKPSLPWADEHFEQERVSGDPINPGLTWRIWPFSKSADTHRRDGEVDPQFDHSYAERYWPKFAGLTPDGVLPETPEDSKIRQGVRFPYGDLDDLVELLVADPTTRQAYLPVWFPEDLGAARLNKRVPCTLGYHFICRDSRLHVVYPMRSCDFFRHFLDDIYLTVRLLIQILNSCKLADPAKWHHIVPGAFTMHITSLHMFESDRRILSRSWEK